MTARTLLTFLLASLVNSGFRRSHEAKDLVVVHYITYFMAEIRSGKRWAALGVPQPVTASHPGSAE
jgi:hypothetical protein